MKWNDIPKVFYGSCCLHICMFILFCITSYFMAAVVIVANQDTSTPSQYLDDWYVRPFIDIRVQDAPCAGSWDPVFIQRWPGTFEGCKVRTTANASDKSRELMTKSEYEKFISQKVKADTSSKNDQEKTSAAKSKYPCFKEAARPGVDQTSVLEKYICGKRGSVDFATAKRPTAGKCPSGTKRCSSIITDPNTICIPDDLDEHTQCPIVDMQFVDENAKNLKSDSWKKIKLRNDNEWLVYTRRDVDSLPLTKFAVGETPCIRPNQQPTFPNYEYWKLEAPEKRNGANNGCDTISYMSTATDPRYEQLGGQTTIYEVQNNSTVLSIL